MVEELIRRDNRRRLGALAEERRHFVLARFLSRARHLEDRPRT